MFYIKGGAINFGHMKTLHVGGSLPHEAPLGEHLPCVVSSCIMLCSSQQLGTCGTTLSFSQIWKLRSKRLNISPKSFIASQQGSRSLKSCFPGGGSTDHPQDPSAHSYAAADVPTGPATQPHPSASRAL